MSNLSSKKVQDIQSLYESIYQEVQEGAETISEEDFCNILAIEICNALIKEGLLEGEVITETTIKEGKLGTAWDITKTVIKQGTGLFTKPTTKVGMAARGAQTLATGAALSNPVRAWNTVAGAVKGAFGGATQPPGGGPVDAANRAIQAAQGKAVPAANDTKKNNGSGTTTWSTPR